MSWTRKLRETFAADSATPAIEDLVLSGLNEVKWADLQHAYGSAADVPAQLRDLASRDRERGEKALHAFYGNIWHQGTTYEATRYAVPFLRQILADQLNPFRDEILELLVQLAFGHSYHDVHQSMIFYEDERDEPEFQDKIKRELNDVEAAHEAVRAGVPQYLEMWDESAPHLRTRAIYLASLFGKLNPEVGEARRQKFAREFDDAPRAALWLGWFFAAPDDENSVFIERAFAMSGEEWTLERWALSALTVRFGPESAREAAAQVLLDSMDAGENEREQFARLPHFEEGLASASLAQLMALGAGARRFTPAFVELLRRADDRYAALSLLESLCPLYFGNFNQEVPVKWADLDESQREVALAIAETGAVWGDEKTIFANLSEQLRYFGLPENRAELRALIGARE